MVLLFSGALHSQEAIEEYETILLKNGSKFEGVTLQLNDQEVLFRWIIRRPGARTVTYDATFKKDEVTSLTRITPDKQKALKERLEAMQTAQKTENSRAEALKLKTVPWTVGEGQASEYGSKYFTLVSNANEKLVRMVALRLEELFAAFAERWGTKRTGSSPRFLLFKSVTEQQGWLKKHGKTLLNAAVFDPVRNEVVVASDHEKWQSDLEEISKKHEKQLQELDQREKDLWKHFGMKPPEPQLKPLHQLRRQIQTIQGDNKAMQQRMESRFFAVLFHEAFHAYMENYLYASQEHNVPRWLNEGWAQQYETAIIETGELRPGRMDRQRLEQAQEDARRNRFLTLSELLNATSPQFQVKHADDTYEADRFFNAAWALASFLDSRKKLRPSPELDAFVSKSADPIKAFEKLMGEPLETTEKAFLVYVKGLR